MSYPHTLEDIFSGVRVKSVESVPHYASVDSAPQGLAVTRSRWIVPVFLSAFTVASIAVIYAEPWLRQLYISYLGQVAGVAPSAAPPSLGVRPVFLAFLLTFWPFVNGSWGQKLRLVFWMSSACVLTFTLSDGILLRLGEARGISPFSLVGNIFIGYLGFLSILTVIMTFVRMPSGIRTGTTLHRPRFYISIGIASILIGAVVVIWLVRNAQEEVNFLRDIALLGGLGPGVPLLFHIMWPTLALLGGLILVRRKTKCKSCEIPDYSMGIVVPAYNEAEGIAACIRSLDAAAASYPGSCWLYVIDNGSTDSTVDVARRALSNCRALKGQVLLCPERGKAAALNFGVAQTVEDIVVRVDADTLISPSSLWQLVPYFSDPAVGVVGGIPLPKEPSRLFSRVRAIEVYYNIGYVRLAQSSVDAVLCVPGIQTAYRRQALVEAGPFSERMNGEDTDMTVRIGRMGYRVVVDPSIHVFSEVPATWDQLREQRIRWSRSALHVVARNKSAIFMRQGVRGLWTLPFSLFGAFRRPFLLLFLIYALLVLLIEPSALRVQQGALLGAVIAGPGAITTLIVLAWYRRFQLIPFLPAYLVFRILRGYLAIEMLFTLSMKPPPNSNRTI